MAQTEHTALAQALGFVYQFVRATYRLLEANSNVVSVGVEHADDVSVHYAGGAGVFEQDKTSIQAIRPLTDRSTALWKTLSIWAQAVLDSPSLLRMTEFHLVTNGELSTAGLARRIHEAKAREGMDAIASELQTMALDLREELVPFGTVIGAMPVGLLSALVGQIYVFDKIAPNFGGTLEALPTLRYFAPLQRQAIFDGAAAWVRQSILNAAVAGEPTLVERAAFDREVRALVRRVQAVPLAAAVDPTLSGSIDPARYAQYGFFQQLEWVDVEPDFARECAIHYALAKAARVKWADGEGVSEAALRSYEEDLRSRWRLHVQRQKLHSYASQEQQGHTLLLNTLEENVPLDGQPMPKPLTCGNYHALADFDAKREPTLGWHPDYKGRAKGPKEEK